MGVVKWAALAAVGVLSGATAASAGQTLTMTPHGFTLTGPIDGGQNWFDARAFVVLQPGAYDWTVTTDADLTNGFVYWYLDTLSVWECACGTIIDGAPSEPRTLFSEPSVSRNGNTYSGQFIVPYDRYFAPPDPSVWNAVTQEYFSKTKYVGVSIFPLNQADAGKDFSLTVTTAPEPSTWLLMIAGFGLAGVALRRRALATA